MRLLHTGDWHIGKTIRGRARTEEFAAALDALLTIATSERVDAVLVAGDLYDQRTTSPDADAVVFDALLRLHRDAIPVVAIAGNHDSPSRFEAFAPLLETIGVRLVPRVRRPDDGGVVELFSHDGTQRARIACMPFIAEGRLSDATETFAEQGRTYASYADGLHNILRALEASFDHDCVNVVLGHLFVDGARPGGGERQLTLGGAYTIPPSALPGTASYVALGHVHRPQAVRGAPCPARYSGSLLQLDFGDRDQDKSVVVIDVAPGKPARVRAVPLGAGRRLLDVTGTIEELPALAQGVGDAFLRVTLKTDGVVPGIADRVREILPNALDVRLDYPRDEPSPEPALDTLEPRDQFVSYYSAEHGAPPAEDLLAAFDRVYEELTQ